MNPLQRKKTDFHQKLTGTEYQRIPFSKLRMERFLIASQVFSGSVRPVGPVGSDFLDDLHLKLRQEILPRIDIRNDAIFERRFKKNIYNYISKP